MFGNSVLNHTSKVSCIVTTACAMMFLVGLTVGAEVSHAPATPTESEPAKRAFTFSKNGEYAFDTGILRGKLRQAGKSLGLSSVAYVPLGVRLDGGFGILSHYRVFTTNKREKCWQADGEVAVISLQSSSEFSRCSGRSSTSPLEATN